MPMAVPGDPVEIEAYLKRAAVALIEYEARKGKPKRVRPYTEARRKYDRAWRAKNPEAKVKRRAREQMKYETDAIWRAKKRLRTMRSDFARYQWAIKWELALPRLLAKVMAERV